MGTKGRGHCEFVWEIYASLQWPVAASDVKDNDLEIFTHNIPFNFTIE